jgi:hypothetical protein
MNDFLKNLVPMIGTALGGPFGAVAATFAANALGLDSKDVKTVSDVLTGGSMTADQVTQLKLAELEMAKWMADNEIRKDQLSMENTKDARDMQKQTRSFFPATLSTIITVGFFGILTSMLVNDIKPSEPLLVMLGALGAGFGAVVNFWLGSNSSSARKTELLAASHPANQ